MNCYSCKKASTCPLLSALYEVSLDFSIKQCKNYEAVPQYEYRKIARHDELMHLIYDYFTGQVEGGFSDEQVVNVIKRELQKL